MAALIDECVERLRAAGVELRGGLDRSEITSVQQEFGFEFNPDHAALLRAVLPTGDHWPDWRRDKREDLRSRLEWPTDGVLFDVRCNSFWPASWGPRPAEVEEALDVARRRMALVPVLVPVHSHRFMPAAPAPAMSPVFSVYQTDVVYYGYNLLDYVSHEFDNLPRDPTARRRMHRIAFWSGLAESVPEANL